MSHDPYLAPSSSVATSGRREHPRVLRILAAAWIVATMAAIAWLVLLSFDPARYYRPPTTHWTYRWQPVAALAGVMLAQAWAVPWAWFGSLGSHAWQRAICLGIVVLPLALMMNLVLDHDWQYLAIHVAWNWIFLLVLALTAIVDFAFHRFGRRTAHHPPGD